MCSIPVAVDKIAIAVTLHDADCRGQFFGRVSYAFVRAVDEDSGQEARAVTLI